MFYLVRFLVDILFVKHALYEGSDYLQGIRWRIGLDLSGLKKGQVTCSCKSGNEPSDFIKYWEFLTPLRECQLFKKDSDPRI